MKSAYELAMERLKQSDPDEAPTLTEEAKAELAEIDRRFQAKIAEREVFLEQQLRKAEAEGDAEAVEQLRKQLQNERKRLESEREADKDAVRARQG